MSGPQYNPPDGPPPPMTQYNPPPGSQPFQPQYNNNQGPPSQYNPPQGPPPTNLYNNPPQGVPQYVTVIPPVTTVTTTTYMAGPPGTVDTSIPPEKRSFTQITSIEQIWRMPIFYEGRPTWKLWLGLIFFLYYSSYFIIPLASYLAIPVIESALIPDVRFILVLITIVVTTTTVIKVSTDRSSFLQEQVTPNQAIISSRLRHPTEYHKKQRELRNQNTFSSDGMPPTPGNSFTNTIDPVVLRESEMHNDLDFCPTSPVNSTPILGSPPNYDNENDYGRSFKPSGILDRSSFGGSPVDASNYMTNLDSTSDYYIDTTEFNGGPTTAIPMDVKPSRNNHNNKIYRQTQDTFAGGNHHISMSLPAHLTNPNTDWPYGTSLEPSSFQPSSFQPGSLQFPPDLPQGLMDSDDPESAQKQQLIFEKRRRRRESHNAELSTLLPELYIDSTNKPNKGVILRKSVEYIRLLKQTLEDERNKTSALEARLKSTDNVSGGGTASSPFDDYLIIGAGVVGLSIAERLSQRNGKSVLLLEKNSKIGEETSSRNSEVIHAGIYYPNDSLKTRLCIPEQVLVSPTTGIFDSHAFINWLEWKFRDNSNGNGNLVINSKVTNIIKGNYGNDEGYIIEISDPTSSSSSKTKIFSPIVINSAGLHSDKIANLLLPFKYKIYYVKGHYYSYRRKYLPDMKKENLFADYSGIRPKLTKEDEPFKDFIIKEESEHGLNGFINLIGIESPGLTSSLAIAEMVDNMLIDK
ncbi:3430_t:CDS:10 [Diversispora eburnea]|uniref:L-2-hydroxyglutarate dehydrogenase, mitochondrial n=1 Tax=Diversispora eburnea TaxID=1213867 RepID=A0A9N8VNK3_9GLOM|nr:3430_t:CDS:10 [Diversispora eburnea]